MSSIKRLIEENEEKNNAAIEIALRVGLLDKCEQHHYFIDPGANNFEEAYKLANSLITKSDSLVKVFEGNRKELTDILSTIIEDYGECPACASRD